MNAALDPRPLIVHVVHRFGVGGLENGVVNLVNHMPRSAYRHAIVALTEVTDFRNRIARDDVTYVALNKGPGQGVWLYPRLHRLFRELRPSIVHTRNLAALEMAVPAWTAGVPVRIHGEHGRDVLDLDGSKRRYRWVRRAYRPFVSQYIALSHDLAAYLNRCVGIPTERITQIYNGVDTARFRPAGRREPIAGCPFDDPSLYVFGFVGRMAEVKDPIMLAHAFVRLRALDASLSHTRLVLVGDGPLWQAARDVLDGAGLVDSGWMPGERDDVPAILRGLDCFVLPSRAEGVSNTILEAMATGLPVIATDVGGNVELVERDVTGRLSAAGDSELLAREMLAIARDPAASRAAGVAGRARAESHFSLDGMVRRYTGLYDQLLQSATAADRRPRSRQRTKVEH